jgi:hypothetical protein
MNNCRFLPFAFFSLAVGSLMLAALVCRAQAPSTTLQPEKSTDPAIRWQFDTRG